MKQTLVIEKTKEKEFIGLEPSKVKIIYSDETIAILQDVQIQEKLKEAHKLRAELELKKAVGFASDCYVIILALDMYIRHKEREIKNKLVKEGVKND